MTLAIRPLLSQAVLGLIMIGCSSDDGSPSSSNDGGGDGGSSGAAIAGTGGSDGGGDGGLAGAAAGGGGGAAPDAGVPEPVPLDPLDYSDESLWLCLPGASGDHCAADQTVTAIVPDGTLEARPAIVAASSPTVDCFYVYPTVTVIDPLGNKTEFDNVQNILDPLMAQFAPFKDLCAQYAPFYRQMTFPTYEDPNVDRDGFLDVAYADVENAFDHYLSTYNEGRDFVLVGHSQGAHMLRRLLQRRIEGDVALTERLLVGLLIGPVGDITVPDGEVVGGTFESIPLCTQDGERGCVITYNAFADASPPLGAVGFGYVGLDAAAPAGSDWGCTNPGALGGGPSLAAGALAPSLVRQAFLDPGIDWGTTTDLVLVEGFYTTECKKNADGKSFLSVSATPGSADQRTDRIPYDAQLFDPARLGLHLLDFVFPMQELKEQVRSRL